MVTREAIVYNSAGIHCRPSAVIVRKASEYTGEICVETANGSCDLKSVLDLISLGMDAGTHVTITVTGPDEEQWCATIVELFEYKYDFPPRDA